MKQTHTATPWAINKYKDCIYQGDYVIAERPHGNTHYWEANAKFIVKACNSHESLVGACKEVFELFRECTSIRDSSICINFAPKIDAEMQYDYLFKKLGEALKQAEE